MAIYRYRPINDFTIEELRDRYLWFSRPCCYSDTEDANIIAFAEANEKVKDAFDRVFSNYIKFGNAMMLIGICCFTEILPSITDWKSFPHRGCRGGIFIEYDKIMLENHFLNTYGLGDCFKTIEYHQNPTILTSSTSDGYDILWEIDEDGNKCYKSIRGSIERDIKEMDEFILRLLTRLDAKYKAQNESRIILAGRNIPNCDPDLKGYKIRIPTNSISNIYVHPDTAPDNVSQLKQVFPNLIFMT